MLNFHLSNILRFFRCFIRTICLRFIIGMRKVIIFYRLSSNIHHHHTTKSQLNGRVKLYYKMRIETKQLTFINTVMNSSLVGLSRQIPRLGALARAYMDLGSCLLHFFVIFLFIIEKIKNNHGIRARQTIVVRPTPSASFTTLFVSKVLLKF